MADELISESVREFIAANIDSVAELEALMLLFRDSTMNWSVATLAERLYADREQTEQAIAKLRSVGVAASKAGNPVTYHFKPSTPELGRMVNDLAETYTKYLVPVTNLIHSKPQSRVQQFADAFKLKKGRDE